jgi:hypothetical protein
MRRNYVIALLLFGLPLFVYFVVVSVYEDRCGRFDRVGKFYIVQNTERFCEARSEYNYAVEISQCKYPRYETNSKIIRLCQK